MTRLYQNQHIALTETRHGLMMFNHHDRFVGRSLELYGEWGQAELDLLGQCIAPGALVLDVGANIGSHTLFFAKAVGRSGAVIAFEPQRHAFQMLCGNVALNALLNVDARRCAVGASPGAIRVPVMDPTAEGNFGALSLLDSSQGESVPVLTIDSLQLPRCDLIKADVEGMEVDVLEGARQTIARHRPLLFVENNDESRSRAVIEQVQRLEYRAFWHLAGYFQANNHRGTAENIFAGHRPEANMLCVHQSIEFSGLEPVTGPDDDWKQARARLLKQSAGSS